MLRLRPRGFRAQIVVSTILLMAFVMIALTAGTQAVLEWNARNDVRRTLNARTSAVLAVVRATDEPLASQSWNELDPLSRIYDDTGTPVGGSIQRAASREAGKLALQALQTDRQHEVRLHSTLNLRAVPFTTSAGQRGVAVVIEDSKPYERSELETLVAMVVLGTLVVATAAWIAFRVTRQALEPVQQMAERADDWSEHDLTHRFDLGEPDNELSRLGQTLDNLLDRVAAAIRAEQRLTAELAHELRTPLTAIQGSADLALMRGVSDDSAREDLEEIAAAARRMGTAITTLLELARQRSARGQASTPVPTVVEALRPLVPEEIELRDETTSFTIPVAAPADLVVRALSPLVENAVRYADSVITLSARATSDRVELIVADDGPGIPDDIRDDVFEPGASTSGSTGLGLGIARRVAHSLGGEVQVDGAARDRGAAFVVSLPRR
jgi:signal transduction histidine kinase